MFLLGLLLTLTVVGAPIGVPLMILANSNSRRQQFVSCSTQNVGTYNENTYGQNNSSTGWSGQYEADVYVPGWQD